MKRPSVLKRLASSAGSLLGTFTLRSNPTSMTLSMEDGYARLLVLKGNRVIGWRSGQVTEPAEIVLDESEKQDGSDEVLVKPSFNLLGTLLDGIPARSKRVVVDLPLHVPLLRHIPLPDVKGRFLREIVNAEVMNSVPFSQDEVDIKWKVEQTEEAKEASVMAIPRERMDHQISLLRSSNLAPSAVYSKASSLAVAVGHRDVFILHVTGGQTAVILVRDGVTRIVHRVELLGNLNEQAESIAMGVGQVAGYHRSQRPEDDVAELPVVVTGELDGVEDLLDLLGNTLGRRMETFSPAIECPEGFAPSEFASNIGLHLAAQSKSISAQNVLPERHRPRPLPVLQTGVFAGLLAFLYLAVLLTGWVSGVADEQGLLEARLDIRENQARDYRLAVARQRVVDQRINDTDLEVLGLESQLVGFGEEMDTLLSRLGEITGNAAASNVVLSRLVPITEGFSVSGSSITYGDVLEYAALMRASPNFDDATVLQAADSSGGELGFTVVITVSVPEEDVDEPEN